MSRIEQACLFDDAPEYDAFVDKFKPQKTTDDCYTPPLVFQAIQDWVCNKYDIAPESIVRPFYPGGDYESFEYPDGCVVLDNPPFSITPCTLLRRQLLNAMPITVWIMWSGAAIACLSPNWMPRKKWERPYSAVVYSFQNGRRQNGRRPMSGNCRQEKWKL